MQLIRQHFSALIAVISSVSVLGGGFYAYGVFENRIAQLESREYVISQEVDLMPVYEKMELHKEALSKKISDKLREKNTEIGTINESISEMKTNIAVIDTEMELLKLQMEELNLSQNPLQ
mgnify:CR=1 FL=1